MFLVGGTTAHVSAADCRADGAGGLQTRTKKGNKVNLNDANFAIKIEGR